MKRFTIGFDPRKLDANTIVSLKNDLTNVGVVFVSDLEFEYDDTNKEMADNVMKIIDKHCPQELIDSFERQYEQSELQTRRTFFRNAVKSILPFVGFIVADKLNAQNYFRAVRNPVYGGCNGCESTCGQNGCSDLCSGTCSGGCSSSCRGTCETTCHYGCETTCKGQCGSQCGYSCQYGCSSSCEGGCRGTCIYGNMY